MPTHRPRTTRLRGAGGKAASAAGLLAAILAIAPGPGADAASPPGLSCAPHTLVVFTSGANERRAAQLFPAHLAYTIASLRDGRLLTSGPFRGAAGGLMIFASPDWRAVQRLLRDEPFTRGGVFAVARHEIWDACSLPR